MSTPDAFPHYNHYDIAAYVRDYHSNTVRQLRGLHTLLAIIEASPREDFGSVKEAIFGNKTATATLIGYLTETAGDLDAIAKDRPQGE